MCAATTSPGDYAIIGNGRSAALVSPNGAIDWLCWPNFSSPSVFAALLDDERGGHFTISLPEPTETRRRYLPGTAVLETTLHNRQGTIRLTDCMPFTGQNDESELEPMRELLRHVEVLEGEPEILIAINARPDYGVRQGHFKRRGANGWALNDKRFLLNLLTDCALEDDDGILRARHQGRKGEDLWFSLTFEDVNPAVIMPLGEAAQQRIDLTCAWWYQWCRQNQYDGPWRDVVERSAITLRQLTFSSGALLAAATTSLPEKPGGWMNWDYRYCWPRDAALSLSAFLDMGLYAEAEAFFEWLMRAANVTRPQINVVYDVWGRDKLPEHVLPLAGFGGARPVRVGNAAYRQTQHDVYGEVMLAVEDWIHRFGKPQKVQRRLIEGFGKAVHKTWREPDNGIWELRDKKRHYTYSKVMAWYVFNSLIRLHEEHCLDIPVDRYRQERDAIQREIETRGFNKQRNSYVGAFDSDAVDASLLLLPRCGYIDYNDPRMLGTWQAIRQDLERNGMILRYPPGFAGSQPGEGAFIICNCWAVDYLTGCGAYDEAEARLERLLSLENDVGLYNEGMDVETLCPLGNMPQAFSHAGLINSIMQLHAGKGQHHGGGKEPAA